MGILVGDFSSSIVNPTSRHHPRIMSYISTSQLISLLCAYHQIQGQGYVVVLRIGIDSI
jgi:hypothetical protein